MVGVFLYVIYDESTGQLGLVLQADINILIIIKSVFYCVKCLEKI